MSGRRGGPGGRCLSRMRSYRILTSTIPRRDQIIIFADIILRTCDESCIRLNCEDCSLNRDDQRRLGVQ